MWLNLLDPWKSFVPPLAPRTELFLSSSDVSYANNTWNAAIESKLFNHSLLWILINLEEIRSLWYEKQRIALRACSTFICTKFIRYTNNRTRHHYSSESPEGDYTNYSLGTVENSIEYTSWLSRRENRLPSPLAYLHIYIMTFIHTIPIPAHLWL